MILTVTGLGSASSKIMNQTHQVNSFQTFSIKQQPGHGFSSGLFYDVFDSNSHRAYRIEIRYQGWNFTRQLLIKDQDDRLMSAINPVKEFFSVMFHDRF